MLKMVLLGNVTDSVNMNPHPFPWTPRRASFEEPFHWWHGIPKLFFDECASSSLALTLRRSHWSSAHHWVKRMDFGNYVRFPVISAGARVLGEAGPGAPGLHGAASILWAACWPTAFAARLRPGLGALRRASPGRVLARILARTLLKSW